MLMSTIFHTTGIILSRRDFREVDRWYSVLTKEHGKIEFLARGGHKTLAKLTPHLETIAEVELLLVQGRHYPIVAGVERRQSYAAATANLPSLLLTQNALALVDEATKTYERDPAAYQLLSDWLNFLCATPAMSDERAGFLLGSFMLKLMDVSGYRPQFQECLSCQREIEPGRYLWQALKGGVVCRPCVDGSQEQWFAARSIEDETLKLVRFALDEPFAHQIRPNLSGIHIQNFHEVLESFVVSHFPTIPAVSMRTACVTV